MVIISKKVKSAKLELVGSAPQNDLLRLKSKIEALGLNEVVYF